MQIQHNQIHSKRPCWINHSLLDPAIPSIQFPTPAVFGAKIHPDTTRIRSNDIIRTALSSLIPACVQISPKRDMWRNIDGLFELLAVMGGEIRRFHREWSETALCSQNLVDFSNFEPVMLFWMASLRGPWIVSSKSQEWMKINTLRSN